jgi:anti-sigma regulatory factor (Ser/Thr protein kinase)
MPETASLSLKLAGVPSSVDQARSLLRGFLGDSARKDDAVTILSELATNAVLHSLSGANGGEFELRFELVGGSLRLEVIDQGKVDAAPLSPPEESFAPAEDPAFPHGESGRGLLIVDAYADRWGRQQSPGRGLWWAELDWKETA